MSDYQDVIDALHENDLNWGEIDRILLNPDTYEDFQDRASFKTSNYSTDDAPAVRETTGQEKIIHIRPNGVQVTIEI